MISQGHLVQDWKDRVGIAIGPCDAPDSEELDESLERVVRHWAGSVRWWRIVLLSGNVVRSPEQAIDSLGPANNRVIEWAIKHADQSVAEQLSSFGNPTPTNLARPEPTLHESSRTPYSISPATQPGAAASEEHVITFGGRGT